jgi:hypothetical protein
LFEDDIAEIGLVRRPGSESMEPCWSMSTTMARPEPETKASFSNRGWNWGAELLRFSPDGSFLERGPCLPVCRAETKNYYFPEVRIDIGIGRDGSFAVD